MWQKWLLFWHEGLWSFRLEELKGLKKFWFKVLRLISLSVRGFSKDLSTLRASSLTYYTLMSIVPVVALTFSIARVFGFQDTLRADLLEQFKEHETALTEIIFYSDQLLEQTQGGIVALVGIAILLWTALQLIGSMEAALNHTWEVHRMRSWRRILSEYVSLLFIAPLFFVLSSTATVFAVNYLELFFHNLPVLKFFLSLLPLLLFSLFFTFLYYFLPNTRVKISSSFLGGFFAGFLYLLVQWVYIYFQIGVSRYGAIYGSLAALPLFLVWLQASWFIFLLGAEVTYAHQSLENYEYAPALRKVSYRFKRILSLWILQLAAQHFKDTFNPLTQNQLVHVHKIPYAVVHPVLNELVKSGLLIEVKEGSYLLGRPLENLRISDALEALDTHGLSDLPFFHSKELALFEKALRSFADLVDQSPDNQLISQLK